MIGFVIGGVCAMAGDICALLSLCSEEILALFFSSASWIDSCFGGGGRGGIGGGFLFMLATGRRGGGPGGGAVGGGLRGVSESGEHEIGPLGREIEGFRGGRGGGIEEGTEGVSSEVVINLKIF